MLRLKDIIYNNGIIIVHETNCTKMHHKHNICICNSGMVEEVHFTPFSNAWTGRGLAHYLCENSLMSWNAGTLEGMLSDDLYALKCSQQTRRSKEISLICVSPQIGFSTMLCECQTSPAGSNFGILRRQGCLRVSSYWVREDADFCGSPVIIQHSSPLTPSKQ